MNNYYTDNKNQQILLAFLKAYDIKKAIVSPGGTNPAFVVSMQYDGNFEMFSCVDERSAAYMACGMAEQSGEPVILCCTGATASRNYMPGLTEAYYRKLPIVVITCSRPSSNIGHLMPQVTDRSRYPSDIFVDGEQLHVIKDETDANECEFKINRALLALKRRGGGPIHFNIEVITQTCTTKELPEVNIIQRITYSDDYPKLPQGRIGIFIGSHKLIDNELQIAIDEFCSHHNAVVFHDHTSGYHGRYGILYALIGCQENHRFDIHNLDLLIHLGEVSGDYYSINNLVGKQVWRINEDGEIRIRFKRLDYIFEMQEKTFFMHYKNCSSCINTLYESCKQVYETLLSKIPDDLPLCHISVARSLIKSLPANSVVHPSILNALRSWNFFNVPVNIRMNCNVGGFGIDGCTSSLIGASLIEEKKLFFSVTGDLAFFYDLNSIGNRHIKKNVRILLMNDGRGTEFRHWQWPEYKVNLDEYVAGAGHFGKRSENLLPSFVETLGFKYYSVKTIAEFDRIVPMLTSFDSDKPLFVEIFSSSKSQSDSWKTISHLVERDLNDVMKSSANKLKRFLGSIK